MYVAIKTTVIDRIRDRIAAIRRDNREPEYVAVSHEEYDEIRADRRSYSYLSHDYPRYSPDVSPTATIKTYEFTSSGRYGVRSTIRARAREKFMDLPLIVIPAEYVPV